jgi:hypothetical protein
MHVTYICMFRTSGEFSACNLLVQLTLSIKVCRNGKCFWLKSQLLKDVCETPEYKHVKM